MIVAPDTAAVDHKPVDIIVIGGGIYGAAIAECAASRGLAVNLFEKGDYGAATSSASLRVIHGGLRYLQSFDFSRSRSSAMERSRLLHKFPGLMRPERFVVPLGGSLKRSSTVMAAGLCLNEIVSAGRNRGLLHNKIPAGGIAGGAMFASDQPMAIRSPVKRTAYWFDVLLQDPERVVLALLENACENGARASNHSEVLDINRANGRVSGVSVRDLRSGAESEYRAHAVVDCRSGWLNAATPYTERFRRSTGTAYVLAANVVVAKRFGDCSAGFWAQSGPSSKGRFLFVVPGFGYATIGTWYFPLPPGQLTAALTEPQKAEILDEINKHLPNAALGPEDVLRWQVGMLPSISATSFEPADRPLLISGPDMDDVQGLFVAQGEKWTMAQAHAQRMVSEVVAATRGLSDCANSTRRVSASTSVVAPSPADKSLDPKAHAMQRLEARRGNLSDWNGEIGSGELLDCGDPPILRAEVEYALANEQAHGLTDLLRRIGVGQMRPIHDDFLKELAALAAARHGWSATERKDQVLRVGRQYGY